MTPRLKGGGQRFCVSSTNYLLLSLKSREKNESKNIRISLTPFMDDPLLLKLRKSKTKESEKKIDHKAKYFIWFTVFESRGVHNSCLFLDFSNVKKQEKYFEKQFILHYKSIHSFYFDSLVSGNIRSMSASPSLRNTFVRGSRNRKDSNRWCCRQRMQSKLHLYQGKTFEKIISGF